MGSPSSVMSPWSMDSRWLRHRRKVLLPEPEGPMMQRTSLASTSRFTPESTWRLPKDLRTSTALSRGMSGLAFKGRWNADVVGLLGGAAAACAVTGAEGVAAGEV